MERSAHATDIKTPMDERHQGVIRAAEEAVLTPLATFHASTFAPAWSRGTSVARPGKSFERKSRTQPTPLSRWPRPAGSGDAHRGGSRGRQAHLIPLRVARMASSPFAFLRGAAQVMAWDLAQGPEPPSTW